MGLSLCLFPLPYPLSNSSLGPVLLPVLAAA